MNTVKYHKNEVIDNERGFVLIIALLMLVILTSLGIYASVNTNTELQISGNERVAKDVFYIAESGWMRAFQWIENWGTSSAPPLINGTDEVAKVTNQPVGSGTYSYTIERNGRPDKVAGNSKDYMKFKYIISSDGALNNTSQNTIEVLVEKISK